MKDNDRNVELLRQLGSSLGGKSELAASLRENFKIVLASTATYRDMAKAILQSALEGEFCLKTFGVDSFQEAWSRHERASGLSMLDLGELRSVADFLSAGGKKWKYGVTGQQIMKAILEKASSDEIARCLSELMAAQRVRLTVRQNERWIIGPLGITSSIQSRKGMQVDDFNALIEDYFGQPEISQFLRIAAYLPRGVVLSEERTLSFRKVEFLQLLLTYGTNTKIFETMNRLIGDGLLRFDGVKQLYSIIATPCGVFEPQQNGEEALAELISREYRHDELQMILSKKGYFAGDPSLGALEMCLKESPEDLMEELFGLKDLMGFAKKEGLVLPIEQIDKRKLIRAFTLRLGFKVPPDLHGIHSFIRLLGEQLRKLDQLTITEDEMQGLVTTSYVETERVLKDMKYFYIPALWGLTNYESSELLKSIDEVAKREFTLEKKGGIERLTLGELTGMLRTMNRRVSTNPNLKSRLEQSFKRELVFPQRAIEMLEEAIAARGSFVHSKGSKKTGSAQLEVCKDVISKLLTLAEELRDKKIYPNLVRVLREVFDEYGRRYVDAIDQTDKKWVIASDLFLDPTKPFFMHTLTNPIAVRPVIIEKLT